MLVDALVRERVDERGLLSLEGREELGRTLGVKLHDVEAELRAHGFLADRAFLHAGEGVAEGRNEGAGNDPAELAAAILVAAVFGEFLGELVEVGALVEAADDVLGLVFGLDEDVADLVFGRAVGGLFSLVGLADVFVLDRVFLGPVAQDGVDEDLVAGGFDGLLDVGVAVKLGLLGFLKQDGLLREDVLHLALKFGACGLALSDGAVVECLLLGNADGFTVDLEGLKFSVGRAGGHHGGHAENQKFLFLYCRRCSALPGTVRRYQVVSHCTRNYKGFGRHAGQFCLVTACLVMNTPMPIVKTSVRPIRPKSLKLTQVSVEQR